MTVHKLSGGDGYTYLTRQVASADVARARGQDLACYYAASGSPPGRWVGSGATHLGVGGMVDEGQMKALFGRGMHPDADRIAAARLAAGGSPAAARAAGRLGRPFPDVDVLPPLAERVAERLAALRGHTGQEPDPATVQQVRVEEGRREHRPVAGYDLVFTPVKSVSLLWALGDDRVRAAVAAAHHEAVADTLGWIEAHAAFTRLGKGGVAQVDTYGLICAAFDHHDSRAGDPDLHTHVAVGNKVRARLDGPDGTPRWLSLDGRALYAVGVAASERYNTRLEDAVARRVGVRFASRRAGAQPGKRPVREVVGIPDRLVRHFSQRRVDIEAAYVDLEADYRQAHGHAPSRAVQLGLAQQATLATREGKKSPRRLADQQAEWRQRTAIVLGDQDAARLIPAARGNAPAYADPDRVDADHIARTALRVVSAERSTWTRWNVTAEVERQLRPLRFATPLQREAVTGRVVDRATGPELAVLIRPPRLSDETPVLRFSDGESVYVPHGTERYTTTAVLDAEERLLHAAREHTTHTVDPEQVEAALDAFEHQNGRRLDDGQLALVHAFVADPRLLIVGIGPAGAGKTTAMQAAVAAWETCGRRVIPLACSAKSAEVLAGDTGRRAENLHKYLHELDRTAAGLPSPHNNGFYTLGAGDVVLLDEAGMAGTFHLDRLVGYARAAGAQVRLLGDPQQLSAVQAGGALRLLANDVGAVRLTELHRFTDPAEAQATLRLRDGNPAGLDFYATHDRIREGTGPAMLHAAYEGWAADMRAGRTSVVIAANNEDVTGLNLRARRDRIDAGQVAEAGVLLRDGTRAGVGDWIVTRTNDRRLPVGARGDFVKNGDTWHVVGHGQRGGLHVAHLAHGGTVLLPGEYVAGHVQLGYASTVHRVQGTTVDTAHALITPQATRESLYVAASRARERTDLYAATEDVDLPAGERPPTAGRDARDLLSRTLAVASANSSATELIRDTLDNSPPSSGSIESAARRPPTPSELPGARREASPQHRTLRL